MLNKHLPGYSNIIFTHENGKLMSIKLLHSNVLDNFICNTPNLEEFKCPSKDEWVKICDLLCDGILFRNKKESAIDTYNTCLNHRINMLQEERPKRQYTI